uniref:Uncharacterized protein n=1 Tax=viral metagenome TaxID=1070528 RepID=A0A6M3X422_9ZZZZ
MKVNQLTEIVVALYNAQRTGMFWGPPGIGKSASFREAAATIAKSLGLAGPVLERHQIRPFIKRMDELHGEGQGKLMVKQCFGLFDLRLSQTDPVEVGGLPRENKVNGTMEKLPPSWFAHTLRDDLPDHGILLLEELPSAPLSVQTAAYQITLDKVIDDFRLKKGWATFAAGNRLTDGGQYFKMPLALANRLCHIDVESDLDSWSDWAIDNGIDNSLLAFIRFRPELLNTTDEHVKTKAKGFAFGTERQWHAVDDFLKGNPNAPDWVLSAVTQGLVGPAAIEYVGFRKVWNTMPSIDGIIIDPMTAPVPEEAATQFAVMTALAARCAYDNAQQCFQYVDRFTQMGRPEMGMLFVKDMQRRQGLASQKAQAEGKQFTRAEQSPAYTQWAVKNKDLF